MLRELKDKQPFFLGVDAFDPHEAWNVPTTFKLRFKDRQGVEPILPFKTPYSKVEDLDVTEDQVQQRARAVRGRAHLHRRLDRPAAEPARRPGLAERTVVYYLSDHGILLGEHGLMGKANSMLGKEIHSVPYMIRHPEGKRAGETSDYFASTHDVAPTILSFQGLTVPGRMDGEDLTVMFDGADPPERAVLDDRVRGPRRGGRRALAPDRRQPGRGEAPVRHRGRSRRGERRGRPTTPTW